MLLLLGGGLCTLLVLNTASAAGEVRERELAAQNRALSDTEQDLRRQVAGLEAPAALASAAAALGMIPGDHPAFLVINADGSVSVLGDPQAATLPPPPAPATPAPDPSATPAAPDPNATPTAGATPAPDPNATPTPTAAPAPAPAPAQTPAAPAETPAAPAPTTPPAGQ